MIVKGHLCRTDDYCGLTLADLTEFKLLLLLSPSLDTQCTTAHHHHPILA